MTTIIKQRSIDNGQTLAQHAIVLLASIFASVVLHFSLLYWFGERPLSEPVRPEKAHLTPENLPPMSIKAFLQEVEIEPAQLQVNNPDISEAAAQAGEQLVDVAAAAPIVAPILPPPPLPEVANPGLSFAQVEAPPPSVPEAWVRQQVAAVPDTPLTQQTNPTPRWTLDESIPRVAVAPDLAASVDLIKGTPGVLPQSFLPPVQEVSFADQVASLLPQKGEEPLAEALAAAEPAPEAALPEADLSAAEALADQTSREALKPAAEVAAEPGEPPRVYQAIEDRLSLSITVYDPPKDVEYRYFRLDLLRKPESSIPIMPKDVIFIQDISGSITTKRLEAAKGAMKSALFKTLRTGDRFNIYAFRDCTLTPSGEWMTFNPETRVKTDEFIDSLRARGSTDLFLLLQDLHRVPRDPKRPLIAVIITDGEPTAGVTETTRIIGEFSRVNKGAIAVYAFGVRKLDPYFLDMLCYVNRGENRPSSGNAGTLAQELEPLFETIRNPVMKDLTISFNSRGGGEIHPRMLTNLFADRTFTLYGRVPRNTKVLSCQLRGTSADEAYDAVYSFDLTKAPPSSLDLRRRWAERAMFDLLAEYAENPSDALMNKIRAFSRTYGVRDPYHDVVPAAH